LTIKYREKIRSRKSLRKRFTRSLNMTVKKKTRILMRKSQKTTTKKRRRRSHLKMSADTSQNHLRTTPSRKKRSRETRETNRRDRRRGTGRKR